MSENDKLQQAYQLIRSGDKTEAVKLLLPIVRAEPDNADAWWLLANAVEKSDQAKRALQQVLKVRPNDQRARRFLEQLGGTPPPARTPPPTTFDEDVPFTTSGTPPVYEDDPFADDLPPIEEDVWEDPFALDDSDKSDAAFRPPGASRPVDPDLNFDEDPFAPDKPLESPPARKAEPPSGGQRRAQQSRQSAKREQPARSQRQQSARGGQGRSQTSRQRGGQRRPARPIALPGVEEFAEDPFAPDSKVLQPRRSIGLPTILIITLLLALIVVAIVLVLNNQAGRPIGSTSFSVVVTLDGSGGILGDLPLESLALTALVDPRAVEGAVGTAVADPETMATIIAQVTAMPGLIGGGAGIPPNARKLGRIEVGQTVSETVDTFIDDSWTFSGTTGQMIVIELDSLDSDLDPQLYLYTTGGALLADNDDIDLMNDNRNSRIEITLPADGDYTIIVNANGEGGAYELRLLSG